MTISPGYTSELKQMFPEWLTCMRNNQKTVQYHTNCCTWGICQLENFVHYACRFMPIANQRKRHTHIKRYTYLWMWDSLESMWYVSDIGYQSHDKVVLQQCQVHIPFENEVLHITTLRLLPWVCNTSAICCCTVSAVPVWYCCTYCRPASPLK